MYAVANRRHVWLPTGDRGAFWKTRLRLSCGCVQVTCPPDARVWVDGTTLTKSFSQRVAGYRPHATSGSLSPSSRGATPLCCTSGCTTRSAGSCCRSSASATCSPAGRRASPSAATTARPCAHPSCVAAALRCALYRALSRQSTPEAQPWHTRGIRTSLPSSEAATVTSIVCRHGNILHDPRNRQVLVYMRLVEWLRPNFMLLEQVLDIQTKEGGLYVKTITANLIRLGYQVRTGNVVTGSYGCPQVRRRSAKRFAFAQHRLRRVCLAAVPRV